MKVLIGTTNPSKAEWLGGLIGAEAEFLTLSALNILDEPAETGKTPSENAAIKAEFYGKIFQPVVCHDSGLYFAELPLDDPRQPGLHVRTPNGRERFRTDEEMLEYYVELIRSLGGTVTAMYLNGFAVFSDGRLGTHAESMAAAVGGAFIMTDGPAASRHPGGPLDSISVRLNSGLYFTGEPYCGSVPQALPDFGGGKPMSIEDAERIKRESDAALRTFLRGALGL